MGKFRFRVILNGELVGYEPQANKQGAKNWISMFLRATHMGSWRKIPGGWVYYTTIGKYYEFIRERPTN